MSMGHRLVWWSWNTPPHLRSCSVMLMSLVPTNQPTNRWTQALDRNQVMVRDINCVYKSFLFPWPSILTTWRYVSCHHLYRSFWWWWKTKNDTPNDLWSFVLHQNLTQKTRKAIMCVWSISHEGWHIRNLLHVVQWCELELLPLIIRHWTESSNEEK